MSAAVKAQESVQGKTALCVLKARECRSAASTGVRQQARECRCESAEERTGQKSLVRAKGT